MCVCFFLNSNLFFVVTQSRNSFILDLRNINPEETYENFPCFFLLGYYLGQ